MSDYLSAFGDSAHYLPLAVDTLVFTFRVLAGTLSLIAFVDWWRTRHDDEFPPYSRTRNERAWNWACAGMLIGCLAFVALDFEYRPVTGKSVADLFVAAVWWCWATAITERMAARVARPRYVYLGSTIFIIGGFAYAFLAGG